MYIYKVFYTGKYMFYLAIYERFFLNKPHLGTLNKSEHIQKN